MIVRYSESVEIDADRRYDVFAFAGHLEVYQHGMTFRDAVKAIMGVRGTKWLEALCEKYPRGTDYDRSRPTRQRKPRTQEVNKQEATEKTEKKVTEVKKDTKPTVPVGAK